MADADTKELGSKQELLLTSETIDVYLQAKLDEGLASSTVAKYKDAFTHLLRWLADDPLVDAPRLLEWRRYLENAGYSKITVQSYIKGSTVSFATISVMHFVSPNPCGTT